MKKYIAKTNLLLAGKHFAVGDTVELDDDDGERLSAVVDLAEDDAPKAEIDAEIKVLLESFTDHGRKLKKEQLIALGIGLGLDVDDADTKDVLTEKINTHLSS